MSSTINTTITNTPTIITSTTTTSTTITPMALQAAIDSVNTHKIGLKSPLMTPVGKGFRSLNLALR